MQVGDLIRSKYVRNDERAIVLEIQKVGHAPYATVQFMHYPQPSRIFLTNFEVVNESR